jgi:polysaccharide export outer membrane protein
MRIRLALGSWLLEALAPGLLVAALLLGCGATRPYVWVRDLPAAELEEQNPPIRATDRLFVFVRDQATLSAEYEVREDGSIALPLVGSVTVAGQAPEAAAATIAQRLRGVVAAPMVTVSVVAKKPPSVSIVGEVRAPGVYEVGPVAALMPALARAGGLTEFADEDSIYVVRNRPRPERIRFRFDDLVGGDPRSNAFRLSDGDVIVVE